MQRVVVSAVAALCATGCDLFADVSEPEHIGPKAESVAFDGETISGRGVALKFAPNNVRLPISLSYEGVELLQSSGSECEQLAGVAIDPMETAVGDRMATNGTLASTLTATLTGPAITQVVVTYELPYDCEGQQTLKGTSTFTMFPSGRIVRHDAMIEPATSGIAMSSICAVRCGKAGPATLESFWGFASSGERVEVDGNGNDFTITNQSEVRSTSESCVQFPKTHVATRWEDLDGETSADAGVIKSTHSFFVDQEVFAPATYSITSVTYPAEPGLTCSMLLQKARTPVLEVLENDQVFAMDADPVTHIFSDHRPHHSGQFTLHSDVPVAGDFAVALDLGDPSHVLVDGTDNYTLQLPPKKGDPILIWFDGPVGAPITIEATP